MKRVIVSLCALFALAAHADAVTGSVELNLNADYAPDFSQLSVNDTGTKLIGIAGSQVYLEKQTDGYKGNAFGRFFDMTCSNGTCTDKGATQLNIKVTNVPGGYTLDGSLNYVSVHATVTDSVISLSADGFETNVGFELQSGRNGSYSGDGAFHASNPFTATLTTSGSLADLKDPATFIVLVVNPFVRN